MTAVMMHQQLPQGHQGQQGAQLVELVGLAKCDLSIINMQQLEGVC